MNGKKNFPRNAPTPIGIRFGRLIVTGEAKRDASGVRRWACVCDCGAIMETDAYRLRSGRTKSCGCFARDFQRERLTRHGGYKSLAFSSWAAIIQRCENEKSVNYPQYGGSGVSVCARWRESFEAFLEDMGERPSSRHSIDRIDTNGNYEPGNCRWATPLQQARNRTNNRAFWVEGKAHFAKDIAEAQGVSASTIYKRRKAGWSDKEIVLGARALLEQKP